MIAARFDAENAAGKRTRLELGRQAEFCTHDLGVQSRDSFLFILASSPGRSIQRVQLCGSKAGATFRLAKISIGSGLKPRASQRCRNTFHFAA
jgi:hypothetical protein